MKVAVITFILFLSMASVAAGQTKAPVAPEMNVAISPVSYGLVIDNSGSYRTILEKIINVASAVVDENKPEDEGFLVTFVDTPKIVLRQEFTDSKGDLRDAVENMFIGGGQKAILDAVKSSADYLVANIRPDVGRERALVLITDGDERLSASHTDDVIKLLKDSKIKVYVIAISEEKINAKVVDRLVKETGGVKYSPKTSVETAACVKEISAAMRTK